MKKKNLFIMLIVSLFTCVGLYNADCVTARMEGENLTILNYPSRVDDQNTSIIPILKSSQIYIQVTNDYNKEMNIYRNNKENEEMGFEIISPDIYTNITYTIKTFYNDNSCGTEAIKTYTVETGIYNQYNQSNACLNSEVYVERCKEHYYSEDIKKFSDPSTLTEEDFVSKVEEDIKKGTNIPDDRTTKEKVLDAVKEYYLYVLVPFVVITIVSIVILIIVKRGKRLEND